MGLTVRCAPSGIHARGTEPEKGVVPTGYSKELYADAEAVGASSQPG